MGIVRTIRRVVVVLLVAALGAAAPAAAPTRAADTFTVFGSGNGHGLGMSQWGAYGLAQAGWGYRRIVTHFYSGTRVQTGAAYPRRVRVGITWDRAAVHLEARGGPVRLWTGAPRTGTEVASIPAGQTWTVRATRRGYAIRDQDGALVGGRRWGGPKVDLFATYVDDGARVNIPEGGATYSRGRVEFDLYGCATTCRERLIVALGLEEYLYGLGEVPSSWPVDALRAQVVAARSYAASVLRRSDTRAYCNCDITDGASDQVYIGANKELGPDGDRWVAAVDATRDESLTYDGTVIQAFYASSDGGHSENVEDVWHGGNDAYSIPWLRGVCNPGESTSANPWTDWSRSFSADQVTSRLRPYTGAIGTVRRFGSAARGESGRIIWIRVVGGAGSATVSGTELRAALGLPDDRVWINSDRNITGPIREKYDSLMCRPGLPTSTIATVDHGSRMTFQSGGIFRNADADLTVWLRGPVFREYRGVGGMSGRLRLPTSPTKALAVCAGCTRTTFEGGSIYRKSGVGAHALWGAVLAAYLNEGGAGGHLGFPTTRVNLADGQAWASFQHGSIVCDDAGCRVG